MAASASACSQKGEDEALQGKIDRFCAWCRDIGIDLKKVRIVQTAECGLGVLAREAIGADEPALAIPWEAVLTVASVVRSPLGQAVLSSKAVEGGKVSAQALMYIAMIDGLARPESRWHAWLDLLPKEHADPLWWSAEERGRLLAGTQLLHDAARHEEQLREVYGGLFPALSQEQPSLFPSERFTFEAFRWARSSLSSRSFAEEGLEKLLAGGSSEGVRPADSRLTEAERARIAQDCPAVVCPLLDFTNHDPGTRVRVGLLAAEGQRPPRLALAVEGGVAAGAEVLNNYGNSRTNLQFLLGYGFCVAQNPADTVPLRLGASPALRASAVKQRALQRTGLKLEELHELSRREPLPPRLLALLRVMLVEEGSLAEMMRPAGKKAKKAAAAEAADAALLAALQQPLPPEAAEPQLELEVLDALLQQLLRKRQGIRGGPAPAGASHAERHAAHYRQGQLEVLAVVIKALGSARQEWCQRHPEALQDDEEGEEEEEMEDEEEEEGEDEEEEGQGEEQEAAAKEEQQGAEAASGARKRPRVKR